MAPCKLCISTIFDVGSSADERTEVAEFVSLYSWTFTASCYTAVYKKIQKLYFLKGRILYLSLLVQNIRQQGSRHWSLNPCSSPENYLDQHLGFPEAWNCPDFQLASTPWDTLLVVFCCKLSQGGGSTGACISYCLFCGVIPISV